MTCDIVRGRVATLAVGTLTYSAAAPSRSNGTSPYSSSPIDTSVTPGPISAATPENSWDGMTGVRSTPPEAQVSGQLSSANVIAAAWTAISTSPFPGVGRGAVSYTRTSGPSWVCARNAIMLSIGHLHNRNSLDVIVSE